MMPGIKKILKIQYKLDDLFEVKLNVFGFFCSPEQKFKYVCEIFLMSQPSFSRFNFKNKLNVDSTSIS